MSETSNFTGYKQMMAARDAKLAKKALESVNNSIVESVNKSVEKSVNKNALKVLTESPSVVNMLTSKPELLTDLVYKPVNMLTASPTDVNNNSAELLTPPDLRAKSTDPLEAFRANAAFKKRVREFCAENNISKQDFYILAVNNYLDSFVNNSDAESVNLLTHNKEELIMWKTTPPIINLYCKFNPSKKWSVKDDLAAQRFNESDIKVVELGILQTLGNKNFNARVNSFAYFAPEIEAWIETNLPSESVNAILEMNRRKWEAHQVGKKGNRS